VTAVRKTAVLQARYLDAPVAYKVSPSMNEIEMYLSAGVHENIVGLRGLVPKVTRLNYRKQPQRGCVAVQV